MELLSVQGFADRTKRYPNQIYTLIHKGNQYRKLKAQRIMGKWKIPESEVDNFPFNPETKVKNELTQRLDDLEYRLDKLEGGI